MFLPSTLSSKLIFSSLVVAAVMASMQITHAKSLRHMSYFDLRNTDAIKTRRGGCAAFGHSCFGGHGKRTEAISNPTDGMESRVSPPSADDFRSSLTYGESKIPVEIFTRDQSDNNQINSPTASQYHEYEDHFKLPPYFRKWLANTYRRDFLTLRD